MASAVVGKRKRDQQSVLPRKHSKKTAFLSPVNKNDKRLNAASDPEPKQDQQSETRDEHQTTDGLVIPALDGNLTIQIVIGSYERVLHGFAATMPPTLLRDVDGTQAEVAFSDTFLFAAHASSIRCLAISPSAESDKRVLATGSSDERINLYSLSTAPPPTTTKTTAQPNSSLLSGASTAENPQNRSLGNLTHHDRAVTRLHFATRGKLFSAAEDNTVGITRTRDWTLLSSIKAPIPKPSGRPSGDTAAGPADLPAGINDFAIHPSQRLMLTVGRRERCMRLWNLLTGKKAGVLNFPRGLLAQAGEGKHGAGEGRSVLWLADGEAFVVAFDRRAVLFGLDSTPKAVLRPRPSTKLHQLRLVPSASSAASDLLAVSTEDGRILFFALDVSSPSGDREEDLPLAACVAQLGGAAAGVEGRIKDFEILALPRLATDDPNSSSPPDFLVVTGSSDGAVRVWKVDSDELSISSDGEANGSNGDHEDAGSAKGKSPARTARKIGRLLGVHETGSRITCLGAFVMDGKVGAVDDHHDGVEFETEEDEDDESE